MTKKYVLQEFMNLDYSDELLTEEEREGNKSGIHLVVAGKIQCAEAKNGNGRIYPKPILEREVKLETGLDTLKAMIQLEAKIRVMRAKAIIEEVDKV